MNCVPPAPGFLEGLREACDEHGVVLIFDEVMTGFRVALGGAQAYYGVTPDLSTFGKIIGGGMPVAPSAASARSCSRFPRWARSTRPARSGQPAGDGRRADHPAPDQPPRFPRRTDRLHHAHARRPATARGRRRHPFVTTQAGGMFGLYFSGADAIVTFEDVMASDVERFKRFFHLMLDGGVYLAPSAFEAGFTSIAHGDKELEITLNAAEKAFAALK